MPGPTAEKFVANEIYRSSSDAATNCAICCFNSPH